jgi:hypothetical protein
MAFAEVGVTPFEGEQEKETATVAACSNPLYQIAIGTVVLKLIQNITVLLKLIFIDWRSYEVKHIGMETTV